jgi:Flp pilus assembly pilin Flp
MRARLNNEDGVTMIEYAILAALIAVAMIVAIVAIRNALGVSYSNVAAGFQN